MTPDPKPRPTFHRGPPPPFVKMKEDAPLPPPAPPAQPEIQDPEPKTDPEVHE